MKPATWSQIVTIGHHAATLELSGYDLGAWLLDTYGAAHAGDLSYEQAVEVLAVLREELTTADGRGKEAG